MKKKKEERKKTANKLNQIFKSIDDERKEPVESNEELSLDNLRSSDCKNRGKKITTITK